MSYFCTRVNNIHHRTSGLTQTTLGQEECNRNFLNWYKWKWIRFFHSFFFFAFFICSWILEVKLLLIFQGANTSTDEDSHSSGRRTTPMASFTRGATFTRSLSRPEPAGRARPHTPTRLPGASSRPRTPGPTESSQLPRRAATLNRTASHTVSFNLWLLIFFSL